MIKIGKYEFESIEQLSEKLQLPIDETKRLIDIYNKTKDSDFDMIPHKDESGKLILPEGTLIHGVQYENRLQDISREGLLARRNNKWSRRLWC